MGDVLDAVSARIKAPYFGYAVLAFVALNWRAIFMLVMTSGSPEVRLAAFDVHTNSMQLIVWPLVFGAIAAVLAPWIRFVFDWISYKPIGWGELLQLKAEDRKTKEKAKLERSRAELFAQQEEELIARAKRDQQVSSLDDENAQRKVQEDLQKIRNSRDIGAGFPAAKKEVLSKEAVELLQAAHKSGQMKIGKNEDGDRIVWSGIRVFGAKNARELSKYETALKELRDKEYVLQSISGGADRVTEKGWRELEALEALESMSE